MVICHIRTSPVHLDCLTSYLHLAVSSQLWKGLRGCDCTVLVVVKDGRDSGGRGGRLAGRCGVFAVILLLRSISAKTPLG